MRAISLLTLLCSFLLTAPRALADTPWVQVDDDDGIRTWQREVPGQELPSFRGQATIDAPVEAIRAVIDDVARHTDWMQNCEAAALVKRISADEAIVYNRTGTPWPVWDRDVVLHAEFRWDAAGQVLTLSFRATDPQRYPLPDRTVRMPHLEGYYRIERVGPRQSRVTYEVNADVGGSLPRWLAKRSAREMPYKTLDRLRARVKGAK
jgi:START domain